MARPTDSAIGHELVHRGTPCLFRRYRLVQRLLATNRDLLLDREIKQLDAYDAMILDDLGFVQQGPRGDAETAPRLRAFGYYH